MTALRNKIGKWTVTSLAALSLGVGVAAMSSGSAEAYGWRRHGGYGGWRGPGPVVGGVIGGLALGAIAAGAANSYGYGYPAYQTYGTCIARSPIYDAWGRFMGYRRVRVAC